MSLQPALGHQPSHTQATRVVWPLFPPTLSSQPPPLILSSLPHTFLLPIPDSLLFSAPDPSCTPPATGAPTRLSSSLVSLSSASQFFLFSLVHEKEHARSLAAAATTTTVVFTPPPPPSSPAAAQICGIHVPKPPVSVLRPGSGLSTPFGLPCDQRRHPPHCLVYMREDNDDSAPIARLGRPLALLAWAAAWASQSSPAGATVNGTTLCIHSIPSASLFSSPD